MNLPEPWNTIIECRCELDRRYFEQHPEKTEYVRPADPGEFWPAESPTGALVRVVYLGPGVRIRQVLL